MESAHRNNYDDRRSVQMPADASTVLHLVKQKLPHIDEHDCRVYFDQTVKDFGARVRVGLRDLPMPFRGFCVFVDLQPSANWGHRVAYLLASEDFKRVVQYDEQFPPFSGIAPSNWHAVSIK